jgi:hypothetical protein
VWVNRPGWAEGISDFVSWLKSAAVVCVCLIVPVLFVLDALHAPTGVDLTALYLLLLPAGLLLLLMGLLLLAPVVRVVTTGVRVGLLALVWFAIPPKREHLRPRMAHGVAFLRDFFYPTD